VTVRCAGAPAPALSHVYALGFFVQETSSEGLCSAVTSGWSICQQLTFPTLRRYEGMSNNISFRAFQFISFDSQGSNKVYAHFPIVNEQVP
jgi:hypothetical protein